MALTALAAASVHGALREARDRPNLVVVFLDDSGYGDYCFTGNPVIETPNLARVAREGANFYLAYNQPHLGLYAAEEFEGTSRRGLLGDVMAEIDHGVGEVLAALKEQGIAENTLLFFTSDNGPWIRFQDAEEHPKYGEARLHVGYAQPFRDGKGSNWEGGHRVPGLFHWPGTIPPGRRLEPASTLDLLPTVFALAGAPLPEGRAVDGRDIRPLLLEPPGRAGMPPFVFAYSDAANRPAALRSGPWKLHIAIRSQTGESYGFEASREKPLLFHLEHDLGERIDRAAERPELVEGLLAELEAVEVSLSAEAVPYSPRSGR